MSHVKQTITATCILALTLPLPACAAGNNGGGTEIGYSSPVLAQEAQQDTVFGLEAAAGRLGWKTKIYDANLSPDTQASNIQTMIDRRVAAIGAWSLDSGAVGGVYSSAGAAGIPVVGLNSDGTGVASSVWWAANRCDPGGPLEQLATMFSAAKPRMKIIVMGGPPVPSIQANTACFTAAARAAGLDVITSQDNTQDTSANAAALAQDLLTAHPDVEGFWSYNDASALGIASAISSSGRTVASGSTPGIMVTGINGDAAAIDAVRQGQMTATIDANSVASGWATAVAIRDALEGKPNKTYVVGASIVDATTIANYIPPRERMYSIESLPVEIR